MKIAAALQGVTQLFLDTAPVIYYVERCTQYFSVVSAIFQQIDSGELAATVSPVTLVECLVDPIRKNLISVQQNYADLLLRGSHTTFALIDALTAERAAELRARYRLDLPDALQVAVALTTGCDAFLTNDAALRRIPNLRILMIDDLEL